MVLVSREYWNDPAIVDLRAKKNTVHCFDDGPFDVEQYDIVLGRSVWRIVPGMESQIPMAIKAVRKQKYGKAIEEGEGAE